jgi:hypothetical protein
MWQTKILKSEFCNILQTNDFGFWLEWKPKMSTKRLCWRNLRTFFLTLKFIQGRCVMMAPEARTSEKFTRHVPQLWMFSVWEAMAIKVHEWINQSLCKTNDDKKFLVKLRADDVITQEMKYHLPSCLAALYNQERNYMMADWALQAEVADVHSMFMPHGWKISYLCSSVSWNLIVKDMASWWILRKMTSVEKQFTWQKLLQLLNIRQGWP